MFSIRHQILLFVTTFLFISTVSLSAQTPTPTPPDDKPEVVYTQEIRVNISALDLDGNFAQELKKEDVVINEDGRLHQANLIEHIPAKILILLDTGGENRQPQSFKTTRETAQSLINSLQKDDEVAIMQYHDKVELIADWTSDKTLLNNTLKKELNFGKRSNFVAGLTQATKFLQNLKSENRHLVLITNGLESIASQEQRMAAIRNLTATNINVHVLSYTQMEQKIVAQRAKSISGGGKSRGVQLPPGADMPNKPITVPLMTINTDREMMQNNKERGEDLKRIQTELTKLAEDTNGIMYLPETNEEMIEKTVGLAKNIDSQYVVTYTPKRPLDESPNGEIRSIEVTSKRDKVIIQAKRKLLVMNNKQ